MRRRKSSRTSGVVALALLFSVALNILLAGRVLRPQSSAVIRPESTVSADSSQTRAPACLTLAVRSGAQSTNRAVPFEWSQIESSDYRQYIANLRAVGCPEEIIRDIIMADLNQAYATRGAAIWKPKRREYWQKQIREEPSPEQQKKLQALSEEKAEICKELFGVRLHDQKLIDTIFLQTHGTESELAFLPEDRKEAALAALADSGFDEKESRAREKEDYWNQRDELFEEKLTLLSRALSPSELEQFKMRNSELANNLRSELRYFDLSQEEFRLLLEAREKDPNRSNAANLLDRSIATGEVRDLLGDERAKTFERVTDMFYINARKVVEDRSLDPERAEQAWQAAQDARSAAQQTLVDSGLSPEERTNRVLAITGTAEERLKQILGEQASVSLRRDLDTVLRTVWQKANK